MRRPKQRSRVMAEINITPLTDVMMVLLVIFMVTTPLIMKANIDINLPKAHVKQETEAAHIQITLDKKGQLFLDGQRMELSALKPALEEMFKKNQDTSVTVSADEIVPYGEAVKLLDIAKQAGAQKLVLAAEPLSVTPIKKESIEQ